MDKDPYKYFRVEARELVDGLTAGVLELEKGSAPPDRLAHLLRLAHTLKGAARVVKQPQIAELAHQIEGVLTTHRTTGAGTLGERGSELFRLLDEISLRMKALDPARDPEPGRPPSAPDERFETLRVEVPEMDSLLRGLTQAGVQVSAVRKGLSIMDRARASTELLVEQVAARPSDNGGASQGMVRARSLAEEVRSDLDRLARRMAVDLEAVERELDQARETTHRLCLIPAETVFPLLERAIRDAAQALGKRVDFEATGGDVRLDAHVLASLRDALMHVVRNAVAHGIEDEKQRVAAGKPRAGRVELRVERRGGRVVFGCGDDGRGIDVEGVRKAAIARGFVSDSEGSTLVPAQVVALLRSGGLTTSPAVTELSGRGIGLDVVRATAARLKGEFSIRSEPRRGTAIEIQVPVSLTSLEGLIVEAGGAVAAIPLDAVRQTLRVRESDVARSTDGQSIVYDGGVVPFLLLDRELALAPALRRSRAAWSAVVVRAEDRSVAVGVDRLLGTSNIVIRSLPNVVDANALVAGACLDDDGNPQLVLSPTGLVEAARRGSSPAVRENGRAAPVLVIDDSLTTRMLEQSILESAGYDVELAVSAEEAMGLARNRLYSLFLVDVEMPGMNGFEFVELVSSTATLRDIPAILVTSRSAPEDRARGEQVGAKAYIVKSEFDQGQLLQTIRRLIG